MRRLLPLLLSFHLALVQGVHAEDSPGLILRFGDQDARVSRRVAIYVPEGQAASSFTKPGQVKATWEGKLNLDARSRLIFTLEGTGTATLTIDEEVLCSEIGAPR